MDIIREDVEILISPETELIEYTPNPIDEYLVIVNFPEDWEIVHNYITKENEIDGIPNRKIPCTNLKEYSLRSSVYEMSIEEVEILRTHPKVESVELNPAKYPQPRSLMDARFKKDVAFNKPGLIYAYDLETTLHTNGIRSNWSILFANNPSSEPYRGVGIASTTIHNTDVLYSLTGKNVDAVIIDSGCGILHPEFIADDGTYRAKDLILDGPYKVDPDYFITNNHTYTKIVDGVNLGVGISTAAAHSWWTNSSNRSTAFQSLGTISSIDSRYTVGHSQSKTTNSNNNQITSGHGTACASQVGGKSFGLAFECNIWSIRINFGYGYIDASEALDICTIFHNAKKISQNGDPDPTITNNSYGYTFSTGNTNGVNYSTGYRGNTLTYTGNGSSFTVQENVGAARNTKTFTYRTSAAGANTNLAAFGGSGQYNPVTLAGSSDNSAAESAIAAGVIVVSSAGNTNQKLCDYTDVDFNNWYSFSTNYICRVGGVQKGFSGSNDSRNLGAIRVGALDCGVEPTNSLQGATAYAIRKVCYSANGPMINIWAPGEMTMAAGYAGDDEDFVREDDSNFYDTWFNGTSAACPNTVSLICLYLESNRTANQDDVRLWLDTHGSIEIDLSDPYSGIDETGYWSQSYDSRFDNLNPNNSSNIRGNGNLRGATKRVIHNPFVDNIEPPLEPVLDSIRFATGNGLVFRGVNIKYT